MNKIPSEERIELNENDKQLTKLISTIPKDFTFQYNNIQFQQFKNGINSCGKWTTIFTYCIFKGMSLKDFQTKMKNLKKEYKLSYDVLICLIWDDI
jgi:DNA-binding ferritin-like protein (Dps family)